MKEVVSLKTWFKSCPDPSKTSSIGTNLLEVQKMIKILRTQEIKSFEDLINSPLHVLSILYCLNVPKIVKVFKRKLPGTSKIQ